MRTIVASVSNQMIQMCVARNVMSTVSPRTTSESLMTCMPSIDTSVVALAMGLKVLSRTTTHGSFNMRRIVDAVVLSNAETGTWQSS